MHYVGIDLHKRNLVLAVEDEQGPAGRAQCFSCKEAARIKHRFERLRPFRAVIEASGSYRWLYDLLSPLGEVVLAHPLRLRAIVSGRAKTDKLDARLLAQLLRTGLIPTSYVPTKPYAELRELTRSRARLVRHQSKARNELHALLARRNVHPPWKTPFGKGWRRFVTSLELGMVDNTVRDELFERIGHYERIRKRSSAKIARVAVARKLVGICWQRLRRWQPAAQAA